MLHDDVTLDLVKDVDIEVKEESPANVTIVPWLEASNIVDLQSDYDVIVDLEGIASTEDPDFGLYAHISRVILFTKSVLGKKKTFARLSFVVNDNIQTIGTATINPANHNLIARIFTFNKAVQGKKTTFGKTAFVITDTIQTAGINTIGGVDFYSAGLYGAGTYGSIFGPGTGVVSRAIGFGASVLGNIPIKQTAVGEISLASHATPATRTDHRIIIRARTTSGSTGVIRAALYEGANNRSGDLETIRLNNTLTDYSIYIPDAAAATITDYSNLSIKFWGYDGSGYPLTFVIAKIYLQLPAQTGGIQYGVVARPITFTKAVSGSVNSTKTPTAEISLGSHGIPSVRTDHRIIIRARTTLNSSGVIKAALYEGANNRSGDLISAVLTNVFVDYPLVILPDAAATITDYSNLSIKFWGFDIGHGSLVYEVSKVYLELPTSVGNVTQYGVVARPITFVKAVAGVVNSKKTSIAEISLASHGTPSVRTNHSIKVRARTTSHLTGVIKAELYEGATKRSGTDALTSPPLTNTFADYSLPIPDASVDTITSYSNLSIKFWGFDPAGNPLVFEVAEIWLELPVSSIGSSTQYGVVARPMTFSKDVSGFATHFGVVARITTFTKAVSGIVSSGPVTYYGVVARATTFTKAVSGFATHFGVVARVTTFTEVVSGSATRFGVVARATTFTRVVSGVPTRITSLARPITFTKAVAGIIKSKKTATAEISLASHGTPSVRTNHTIKIRARTTTGSTGVIRAELYEGATKRSGTAALETSLLTTTLADYSLPIPDASAATITSYSNLSIKIWGFDSAGNALVFQVAKLYLELPTP